MGRANITTFRNRLPEEETERLNPSRPKNPAMITRKTKEDFNFHRGQLPRPARSEPPERRCDIKDLQLYQNQGTHAGPAGESKSQPSIHSLKRGAVAKQNAPGSLPEATSHEIASN